LTIYLVKYLTVGFSVGSLWIDVVFSQHFIPTVVL